MRQPLMVAAARVLAGLLAIASLVPLWFGTFLALFNLSTITQRPDPTIEDGDPCCGHPDTWSDVVEAVAFGGATVVACFAVIVLAAGAAMFAVTGRAPHRRVRRVAAIATGYLGVWLVFSFIPLL